MIRMNAMNRITMCLWFDSQGEEAASFYTSLFSDAKLGRIARFGKEGYETHKRPEGSAMTVEFELAGLPFLALNGGPVFTFNPSISLFVVCQTESEIDTLWQKLSAGGSTLMELQKYDWSDKHGWLSDLYGLSWQLSLGKISDVGQKITPSLLFVGKQHGRAEEAVKQYTSVFKNSQIDGILRFGANEAPEKEGSVKHAQFSIDGNKFMVMDSRLDHAFAFNEAVSFVVPCDTQEDIDYFWERLSKGGDVNARQCGWLKDTFGVSWQVVPAALNELLHDSGKVASERVMKALLQMKKIDLATLQRARSGE
jgi:predicted 3-demethylubiquinone-9 3-methyltransferase (glyoxalase superfamily)